MYYNCYNCYVLQFRLYKHSFLLFFSGYNFGLNCDRFGLSCDSFGLNCDSFGLSCDSFGLNCDDFGLLPCADEIGSGSPNPSSSVSLRHDTTWGKNPG